MSDTLGETSRERGPQPSRRLPGWLSGLAVLTLIYLFLVQSEPQSFTTIRRSLSLSSGTVDKAARRLLELGYVVLDETYLYWVSPLQQTRNP